MRANVTLIVAAMSMALAAPLAAADTLPACAREADVKVLTAQADRMDGCLRRMKDAKSPEERRKAMDEHMKEMHAGMGHMGGRRSRGCEAQMMDTMMNHMKQHRSLLQESGG